MMHMPLFATAHLDGIHAATLQILEEIGVVVKNDPAIGLFTRNRYRVEGQRVYFPREEIERTI